ncbi:MAG TPA: hypothetical protein VLX28_23625 [Thermoanaerobaculia bacterium]|nr:hypothetical protein [Thermoanaerobaculia bacterium]
MKLPPYPLQAVEDQRRRARDHAQERLAERLRELDAAKARHGELEAAARALAAERQRRQDGLYDPEEGRLDVDLVTHRRAGLGYLAARLAERRRELARQEEAVAAAGVRVEQARAEIAAAAQAVAAIEKHRAGWRQGILAEMSRREEKLIDEITTSNFVRRS